MILLDFRDWEFATQKKYLPNAQKELVKTEFDTLKSIQDFSVVKSLAKANLSDLFFKQNDTVAVSAVKNIEQFYETLDTVLEIEDKESIDYTEAAEEEVYFYGSSSLVAHAASEIAICGVNEKADESLFEEYCEDFEMNPLVFDLPEHLFTSDVAFFAKDKLWMCLEFVKDKKVKKQLLTLLKANNLELVSFTKDQVEKGVLNAVELAGDKVMITEQAYVLFTEKQKEAVSGVNLEVVALPFLEDAGIKLRDLIF